MNPESASSLLPWLIAALAVTLAAVAGWCFNWAASGAHGRAVRPAAAGLAAGHPDRHHRRQRPRHRPVAGEVDNLRDRLDAEQAASRQALQQLHLALVGQLGANKEETTLRLADLANAFAPARRSCAA
jgi:hypothetical protein